jgi:hypothetical protein
MEAAALTISCTSAVIGLFALWVALRNHYAQVVVVDYRNVQSQGQGQWSVDLELANIGHVPAVDVRVGINIVRWWPVTHPIRAHEGSILVSART